MASIYDKSRVKELAEQKMNADLEQFWGKSDEKLTPEEFERYLFLLTIIPEDDKKNWNFYLSDDVYEQIIENGVSNSGPDLIEYYSHPDYDMEMCLEEAKSMNVITGFVKLSDELWVIKDC